MNRFSPLADSVEPMEGIHMPLADDGAFESFSWSPGLSTAGRSKAAANRAVTAPKPLCSPEEARDTFAFYHTLLNCRSCLSKNSFTLNGSSKFGPTVRCNVKGCRRTFVGIRFHDLIGPFLGLNQADACNQPSISSAPTPTPLAEAPQRRASSPSQTPVSVLQIPKEQWEAILRRCQTLEDQVARLTEQLRSSRNEATVSPANQMRYSEPTSRGAVVNATRSQPAPIHVQTNRPLGHVRAHMEQGSTRHEARSVATKGTDSGVKTWAQIAREGQPKSVNELPAQFRARMERMAQSLKSGGYAPLPKRSSQPPKMEAQYFRGIPRGPYRPLMTYLRIGLRSRCIIGLSFIGRSILEIVSASDVSHKLVAGMRAAGYTHMAIFSATSNAMSSRRMMSKAERKKKNLEQALYRFRTAANRTTSSWAKHWYEAQVKMAEQMLGQNNTVTSAKDRKRRQANFENLKFQQ
ncbi:hypothetical protein FGB62_108g01 [Gracilaria domingensis]|nr:hypothetical protein FGB62_108g01 [Gracilaria domingensis]